MKIKEAQRLVDGLATRQYVLKPILTFKEIKR